MVDVSIVKETYPEDFFLTDRQTDILVYRSSLPVLKNETYNNNTLVRCLKWPAGSEMGSTPRFLGTCINFYKIGFLIRAFHEKQIITPKI